MRPPYEASNKEDNMTTGEKYIEYQNNVLKRLALELESGRPTNAITGMVKAGDYDVIQTWTLSQLGYTGEVLECLKPMVNYKVDFASPEWGYLLDKYVAKSGLSRDEAKKKYIGIIEQGYKMILMLEAIYDKNEKVKRAKASKEEAERSKRQKWYA
jgi:hypothetical protein